jgi:hypothetical protein
MTADGLLARNDDLPVIAKSECDEAFRRFWDGLDRFACARDAL